MRTDDGPSVRVSLICMKDVEVLRIGSEIKDARDRAGLSQETVADMIGTEVAVVAAMERGELPVDGAVVERVLVALGLRQAPRWDIDVEIAVAAIGELIQMTPRDNRLIVVKEILQKLREETTPGQNPFE